MNREQIHTESLIISIFGIPNRVDDAFFFFSFFFFKRKTKTREKPYRGALAVVHFTYVRMYLHVYLICTQGPKMILKRRPGDTARRFRAPVGLPSRAHRRTFQRSACDWSASFVCTLTAEVCSSQCLKLTLLLASMTTLSTTVVMFLCFHEYKYSFDFCNLLLAVLKEKKLYASLFFFSFFFTPFLPVEGYFR